MVSLWVPVVFFSVAASVDITEDLVPAADLEVLVDLEEVVPVVEDLEVAGNQAIKLYILSDRL